MKYFPIYLDLKDKKILMIGTGHEAEQKILQMLETGAKLRLISESSPAHLAKFEGFNNFNFEQRKYVESDLDNIWLVISTLADRNTNEYIYAAAESRNIFCNVVDVTDLCTFIFPAIVSRGNVNIAVSTSGTSPALAQNIKSKISELIGPEYGKLADFLGTIRKAILEKITDREERSKLFHQLVNSGAIELFRRDRDNEAKLLLSKIIEEELNESLVDSNINSEIK
jgi:precorrin-2 dehydrogenase/sirohydrochlorin ferrochelatase